MNRRDFLTGTSALSTLLLASSAGSSAAETESAAAASETEKALADLRQAIVDQETSFRKDAAWFQGPDDQAEARRAVLHVLQHALEIFLEGDPAYPVFKRFVTPEKKILGENPDAWYFNTLVDPAYEYRIRGNLAGATYTAFAVEAGTGDGGTSTGPAVTLNDSHFESDAEGNYEIIASAREQKGNWLKLPPTAGSVTTRHYYEQADCIAKDRLHHIPLIIDRVGDQPPPDPPSDASVSAALRRVARFVRTNVYRAGGTGQVLPNWVSAVPNQFNPILRDGTTKYQPFAAADNVYSMAPVVLEPDQALVVRGRFPKCRFSNAMLWNRFSQTLDYVHRRNSFNRKQVVFEKDGSFKLVVAHRDPGAPNWLDGEGRKNLVMFWRFMLAEEDIEPLRTQVVKVADAANA
jgi:hypothetical protein